MQGDRSLPLDAAGDISEPQDAEWPTKYWPATRLMAALSSMPRPWVFTNGVFDLLHRGHVQYLREARALGATLIVAVNSDRSARLLNKGPERPLNRDIDRVWVLSALEDVSMLTIFDDPTPLAVLRHVKPDIYVKGGDYKVEELPEAEVMAEWGGRCITVGYRQGHATTALVKRILDTAVPTHDRAAP